MFWPAKMHHVTLLVPEGKSAEMVRALHQEGVCEVVREESVRRPLELSRKAKDLEARLNELIKGLEPYRPVPEPENMIKSLFFPPKPEGERVTRQRLSKEIIEDIESKLDGLEEPIKQSLDEIKRMKDELKELEFQIQRLESFPAYAPLELFQSSKDVKAFVGEVPDSSVRGFMREFEKKAVLCAVFEKTKEKSFMAVFCHPGKSGEVGKILHEMGFELLEPPYESGKPSDRIKELRKKIKTRESDLRDKDESLGQTWRQYSETLYSLAGELAVSKERLDVLTGMGGGRYFVSMNAWVPDSRLEDFKNVLSRVTPSEHYIELEEREDAPTLLKNPSVVQPFEFLTSMFSLPKYKRFDPTPVLALTYAFFFGFMLTDVVYGLVLALIAFGIYRGIGRNKPGTKQFAAFLMVVGVSTVLLGAAFGSYMGDLPLRLHERGILPFDITGLVDAMEDTMVLIGIAIFIGLLHLSLGLMLGVVDKMKNREYRKVLSNQCVLLAFAMGIILIGASLVVPVLPELPLVGLGLIGLSVVMNIVFKLLDNDGIMAVLSIFDFTGFVGDVLSYARLMALAVGTAGIALAVNYIAFMANDMIPYVGVIIALIVLLVGHIFNMLMNGLGAFVHSLRLHFLEFFTKFYDGGGRPYVPFHAKNKS